MLLNSTVSPGNPITLLIINSIFLIILIIDIISTIFYHLYNYDLLIFLVSTIVGLIYGFKLHISKQNN